MIEIKNKYLILGIIMAFLIGGIITYILMPKTSKGLSDEEVNVRIHEALANFTQEQNITEELINTTELAKCLTNKYVTLYTIEGSVFVIKLTNYFDDDIKYLNIFDCGEFVNINLYCQDIGVKGFPTWIGKEEKVQGLIGYSGEFTEEKNKEAILNHLKEIFEC